MKRPKPWPRTSLHKRSRRGFRGYPIATVALYGPTVVITDRIIGRPHEEGKDYPSGEVCPECPFWADRDRWTGERIQ